MSSGKIAQERTQRVLLDLAAQPGNDVCADCKARNPRWASHNLGIFICVGCASIHRKMGTHISKVKSLTLDSWTKEQVETMKQMGNTKSNGIYNPNETRHPPPINAIDQERDSELEKFIRAKYEFKSYFDRSALVASKLGPSRSATSNRLAPSKSDARLTPSSTASTISSVASPASKAPLVVQATPPKTALPPVPTSTTPASAALPSQVRAPMRSVSQPVPPPLNLPSHSQAQSPVPLSSTMSDLASLQTGSSNASLPLQYATPQYSAASFSTSMSIPTIPTTSPTSLPSTSPMTIPSLPSSSSSSSFLSTYSPYGNLSASPHSPYPMQFAQNTGISPGQTGRSMSLGTGLNGQMNMNGVSFTGGTSPFQQTQMQPQASPAPSPNPFAPQMLPQTPGLSPGQQLFMSAQQPMQMYSPQPQMQQSLQVPNSGNPYLPTPSPQGSPYGMTAQYTNTTPSPYAMNQPLPYTGQPSPYANSQPLPQMQPQQQQPMSAPGSNPFTSWMTQGPQQTGNGYPQQQQWGGM